MEKYGNPGQQFILVDRITTLLILNYAMIPLWLKNENSNRLPLPSNEILL